MFLQVPGGMEISRQHHDQNKQTLQVI